MNRVECPSCSQAPRPDPACPLCGGLGWLLRPGIADGARGLRLETLREASAAWAGVVRAVSPSTASAARALDCSAPTLARLLVAPSSVARAELRVVREPGPEPGADIVDLAVAVDASLDVAPPELVPDPEPVLVPVPSVACVDGCVSPCGHKGWHVGADGRAWRGRGKGRQVKEV